MIDLGYEGATFTWRHGLSVSTSKAARFDRALYDDVWRHLFPVARVKHLAHGHNDHCPLLLQLEEGRLEVLGMRPFRFEAAWILHAEFGDWLKRAWCGEKQLPSALRDILAKLKAWNKATFGNIFRRKRRNELRLGGVQ